MTRTILAIDQGTTSTRALLFDGDFNILSQGQQAFTQHFPASGWVEHDPDDLWTTTLDTCRQALAGQPPPVAIGITNQRETTLVWDRASGRPIHNAIVWQDRRSAAMCQALRAAGHEALVRARTGLLLDPYFSGTKIKWILDHVDGARDRARRGELLFGTVDSWLIWRLTGGTVHATDATNAARTLIYDIHAHRWDPELLSILDIPSSMLPEVKDCADDFGATDPALFGHPIPIRGVAGDQQAATIGQACFTPGMIKSTYGTGCFTVLNTGRDAVTSNNRLLTTIAYRLDGETHYALEGSIFIAGAAVQWLRDGLGVIDQADQCDALANRADTAQSVYLVPAFVGLGAPHWDAEARGSLMGLTRATGPAELARAALESVGYQTRDLLEAMAADWPVANTGNHAEENRILRVDGGMAASDWTLQFLSDIIGAPVDRPTMLETTARGAAWLAGMAVGVYPDRDAFARSWSMDRRFVPVMDTAQREEKYAGWRDAVRRTLTRTDHDKG